ncbi:MAG: manganese efflux pump, partial [Synergistaceae bacterium]|nr:manganese efflux pump [Synergistaceae bacterium]
SLKILIPAAIATSIDALMIGAGFALADMSVLNLAAAAGVLTFIICFAGVYLGRVLGSKFGNKAGLLGGVVLILIGVNILIK